MILVVRKIKFPQKFLLLRLCGQVFSCVERIKFFMFIYFQGCHFDLEVFKAGKKGWGLRTNEEIQKYEIVGLLVYTFCINFVLYVQQ